LSEYYSDYKALDGSQVVLFLDYLRYKTSQEKHQAALRNNEIKRCLETLKQEALTKFLAEASRSYPVDKLNGKTEGFLEEMEILIENKYNVQGTKYE
jgi:hypothetical protein